MAQRSLRRRDRLVMEITAVLYVVAIAAVAQGSGWHCLMFPAFAALSFDVLTRPWGKWASQPGRLVVTPTVAAAVGTLTSRHLAYHVLSLLIIVSLCLLLLAAFRSNIAPTIAAGMLPLVLGIRSWLYPVSVLLGLIALIGILAICRLIYGRRYPGRQGAAQADLDDILETSPVGKVWLWPFFVFVTIIAACAAVTGQRMLLFPPLVVISYELFAHPMACPWALKPWTFPLACVLTSAAGCLAVDAFGFGATAAGVGMVTGIVVLRALRLHLPPALAIGLLPLLIDSPGTGFVESVAIGTAALMLVSIVYRQRLVGMAASAGTDR